MELDSLKDIWKNLEEEDLQPAREVVPITSMLEKRSQGTIARLKRNLNRELISVVIIYSLTIWYIVAFNRLYSELAVLLALIAGAFMYYYYRKSKLLKQMQCVACEVHSNLKQQLSTLEKYVRFYFIAGSIITPLAYFAAGLIILFNAHDFKFALNDVPGVNAQDSVGQIPVVAHFSTHRFFVIFLSLGAVITVSSYFFNRWYINKLYGQHIQKLKELLYQMEEEG